MLNALVLAGMSTAKFPEASVLRGARKVFKHV